MGNGKVIAGIFAVFILLIIGISGCTSSSDSTSTTSEDSLSDEIETAYHDENTGVTYGTTQDGYGYAYSDDGRYTAVSDLKTRMFMIVKKISFMIIINVYFLLFFLFIFEVKNCPPFKTFFQHGRERGYWPLKAIQKQ